MYNFDGLRFIYTCCIIYRVKVIKSINTRNTQFFFSFVNYSFKLISGSKLHIYQNKTDLKLLNHNNYYIKYNCSFSKC